MARKTKHGEYGENKIRYGFMLTETTSEKIDELAAQMNVSRSEVLEKLVRRLAPGREKQLLGKFLAS